MLIACLCGVFFIRHNAPLHDGFFPLPKNITCDLFWIVHNHEILRKYCPLNQQLSPFSQSSSQEKNLISRPSQNRTRTSLFIRILPFTPYIPYKRNREQLLGYNYFPVPLLYLSAMSTHNHSPQHQLFSTIQTCSVFLPSRDESTRILLK